MGVTSLLKRGRKRADIQPLSWDDFQSYFSTGGSLYPLLNQTLTGDRETIESNFCGLASGALKGSGVVFACIYARLAVFSQARFQFRRLSGQGRKGEIFGNSDLVPLEKPWPTGTTADLLARAELDVSLAGNFYAARRAGDRIMRLRPDWVDIVLGSNSDPEVEGHDIDAEIIGFVYYPGGRGGGEDPELLLPDEVAHFAPIPDPLAKFRGMSWLTPIVREILADKATTSHKLKFFELGATPNMKVKMDIADPEKFQKWVDKFNEGHQGVGNHFKTLFLAAGMDADVVGSNLRDIDFSRVQGGGEVRIAAAAGVPADIALLGKSLEGSALNNAAKDSSRRRFGDITLQHLWDNVTNSFAHLVVVPEGCELWCEKRHIPFLKEDVKDAAEALQMQAQTINTLVMAGFDADAIISAVAAGDIGLLLGEHTGLTSVQLTPASDGRQPAAEAPPSLVIRSTEEEVLKRLEAIAERPIEIHLPAAARPRAAKVKRDENGTLTVVYDESEEDLWLTNGNGMKVPSSS